MQQTFIKTINGITLEFNRLLYPIKYAVLPQDVVYAGIVIVIKKDDKEKWTIDSLTKLPSWVREMSSDIIMVIEDNEASLHTVNF